MENILIIRFINTILKERVHSRLMLCAFVFLLLLGVGEVQSQVNYVDLPYFEDFEDESTYGDWELNAGRNGASADNKWYISDGEAFMGEKALYISSDGGKTLSYVNKEIYNVAYYDMPLPIGSYDLSFTWKCEGKEGVDGLCVYWVSVTTQTESSYTEPNFMKVGKRLMFDGSDFLCGTKEWKTVTTKIEQLYKTSYRLVFVWKNSAGDEKTGSSIVIDNIQVSSQACGKPENIKIGALSSNVTIDWDPVGGALGYEMMYKKYGEAKVDTVKGIYQNRYVLKGMSEGVYDVFVRSLCLEDTSIWVVKNNVLVYDVSAHCIDFINWDTEGTVCRTGYHTTGGSFEGDKFVPKQKEGTEVSVGAVDFGYGSVASRHTKHYIPGETDPRTNNGLPTVPEGEVVSVRLGNWEKGGEFESVTYTHQIDSGSNMLLLLKYAIVIQDPAHERAHQPVFMLELLDEYNNPLDATGCGDANFVADTKVLINDPNADGTWHVIGSGDETVLWKEWTTVGINVGQYAANGPLKFKIRLTTYDCAEGGHFGYAYYTLSCSSAEIEGKTCGKEVGANIKAPAGFKYRWYRVRGDSTVCTTQNLQGIAQNDTSLYRCKVMFAQDPTCYFDLDVSLLPHFPKALFVPKWVPCGCEENRFRFENMSYVSTVGDRATGEKCNKFEWYLKEGDDWTLIGEEETCEYEFPKKGGTYEVMLKAVMEGGCEDIKEIKFEVPRLDHKIDTIDTLVCEGKSFRIEGRTFKKEGIYDVYYGKTYGGCDSTVRLNLQMIPKERDTMAVYICDGVYELNGQEFSRSGRVRTKYESSCGCDSIVVVDLTVVNLDLASRIEWCSGDDLVFEYSSEVEIDSVRIHFGDSIISELLRDTVVEVDSNRIYLAFADIYKKYSEKETMPINPIRPGHYMIDFEFYYETDGGTVKSCERSVGLDVLYSSETIDMKFGNLLVLKSNELIGDTGDAFTRYQWYKNGEPIENGTTTYLYFENEIIDLNDIYTVGLVREGEEEEILSCGVSFGMLSGNSEVLMSGVELMTNIVEEGGQVVVLNNSLMETLRMRWLYIDGRLIGEDEVDGERIELRAPTAQGIYLLEMTGLNGETRYEKVVVR